MTQLTRLIESNDLIEFEKNDKFLEFINQDPPQNWLLQNAMANNSLYLPIDKIELLLTRIFQQWYVEVLNTSQIMNSITVTVRLHYKHPVNGWTFQDGVGAAPAKTTKGAKASDMSEIVTSAVQTGLPAAKSFAISDAADHIGRIFGRDLNRKNTLDFSPMYTDEKKEGAVALAISSIEETTTLDELQNVWSTIGTYKTVEAVIKAKDKRKKELTK